MAFLQDHLDQDNQITQLNVTPWFKPFTAKLRKLVDK